MIALSLEKAFIDFLYDNLSSNEIEFAFSVPPGAIVLRGSARELFRHRHVALWHRFLVEEFPKYVRKVVLLLPCSRVKPYRLSPTHRIALSRISKSGALNEISLLALSEPMVLVPSELDIYYPFANYDLPPQSLDRESREIMVEILSSVLDEISWKIKALVATLPSIHESILREALEALSISVKTEIIPYGSRAFKSVAKACEIAIEIAKNFGR